MDKLYAPWRDRYVRQKIQGEHNEACVFCEVFDDKELDEQRFVLWKNQNVAVIMNLYPYNGGHLMVIPKQHAAEYDLLPKIVLSELMVVSAASMNIVQEALGCQGINFGANIGRAAGAGIPDHVHLHIVPRFAGDTGFFTTIGDAKQVSVDLEKIYKNLKPYFENNFLEKIRG